jgi:hypothetical protein
MEATHNTEAINTTTKETIIISKATSIKKIITMGADIMVSNSSIIMYRRNLNLLSNIQVETKRRIEQVICFSVNVINIFAERALLLLVHFCEYQQT